MLSSSIIQTRSIRHMMQLTSGDLSSFASSNPKLSPFLRSSGKDHVCRFVGCGRNDRFNYVVMELQVRVER